MEGSDNLTSTSPRLLPSLVVISQTVHISRTSTQSWGCPRERSHLKASTAPSTEVRTQGHLFCATFPCCLTTKPRDQHEPALLTMTAGQPERRFLLFSRHAKSWRLVLPSSPDHPRAGLCNCTEAEPSSRYAQQSSHGDFNIASPLVL